MSRGDVEDGESRMGGCGDEEGGVKVCLVSNRLDENND